MTSKRRKNERAGFFFVLFAAALGLASLYPDQGLCIDCGFDPDSAAACTNFPVTGHPEMSDDTIKAVAIYACGKNAATDTLPSWWTKVWNPDSQQSVPRYYYENSRGKHIILATPLGRDAGHCFKAPIDFVGLTRAFVDTVIKKADTTINFANFDRNEDDTVDAFFFIAVNYGGAENDIGGNYPGYTTHKTDDISADGDTVIIDLSRTVVVKAPGEAQAVSICAHEWGHALGLPDLYHPGPRGLGSFSIMAGHWPEYRAVPFDPWSRWKLGWVDSVKVNSSLYQESIPNYLNTGKVYRLAKDERQYFLISNHKGTNPAPYWEQRLPGEGGLLIWHVDTAQCILRDEKLVDLELAHGLYNWNLAACTTTTPNRYYGKDSLDLACTYSQPNLASGTCWWNYQTKSTFDGLSNPSSDAYRDTIINGVRMQDIPTCLAVRNIQAGNFSAASADFIINNKSGQIAQNTSWSGCVVITGDVTVNSGVTLTISAGTFIGVASGKKLIVKGTLTCLGTETDSIILTSVSPTPVRGDWFGVSIDSLGRGNFEFVRFSYGDTALNVHADTATVRVRNSTFTHFKTVAVYSRSAKTNLGGQVPEPLNPDCGKNNIFMNTVESGAKAVIKTASPSGTLKAEMNWWGQNPPSSSWFSGLNVDYTNWLAGPATPDTCALGGEEPEEEGPNPKISAVQSRLVAFELKQNYPNPFNPTTTIQYALPEAAKVELKIYNLLGQVVRTLVDEQKEAGYYQASWDGKDEAGLPVSSGVYIYKIQAGEFVEKRKMQLIK